MTGRATASARLIAARRVVEPAREILDDLLLNKKKAIISDPRGLEEAETTLATMLEDWLEDMPAGKKLSAAERREKAAAFDMSSAGQHAFFGARISSLALGPHLTRPGGASLEEEEDFEDVPSFFRAAQLFRAAQVVGGRVARVRSPVLRQESLVGEHRARLADPPPVRLQGDATGHDQGHKRVQNGLTVTFERLIWIDPQSLSRCPHTLKRVFI